jgi:hypothetical protein
MNWLQKISKSMDTFEYWMEGWTEEQMSSDVIEVWQRGSEFYYSCGDWSKIPDDEIRKAIELMAKHTGIDNPKISGESETGPPGDGWSKIR